MDHRMLDEPVSGILRSLQQGRDGLDLADLLERGGRLPADGRGIGDHRSMLLWYRRLIALRREEPDLHSHDLTAVEVERADNGSLVVRRGAFSVVANLAQDPAEVDLGRSVAEVCASFGDVEAMTEASHTLRLGGHAVAVVRSG